MSLRSAIFYQHIHRYKVKTESTTHLRNPCTDLESLRPHIPSYPLGRAAWSWCWSACQEPSHNNFPCTTVKKGRKSKLKARSRRQILSIDCLRDKMNCLAKTASAQDSLSMRDTWMVYYSFLLYGRLMPKLAARLVVVLFSGHAMIRSFSNNNNNNSTLQPNSGYLIDRLLISMQQLVCV
jgi:hypothetical protein